MIKKSHVSNLIKHAINNEHNEVLNLAKKIALSESNKKESEKISEMIKVGESKLSGNKNKSITFTDIGVFPEKQLDTFIHQVVVSEYTFDDIILPSITKKIVNNWLLELENISFLKNNNLPILSKGLFHGPSGTGKTMLAYCIAHELARPLFIVNLASIVSSKLGETGRNLDYVFRVAKEKNAILFLDEIDFFAIERDSIQDHGEARRSLIALFQILDLISNDVIIIAATNLIDSLDPAVSRRFGFKLSVSTPSTREIKKYVKKLTQDYGFVVKNIDKVVQYFNSYNYANIKDIILGAYKIKLLANKSNKKILVDFADIKDFEKGF